MQKSASWIKRLFPQIFMPPFLLFICTVYVFPLSTSSASSESAFYTSANSHGLSSSGVEDHHDDHQNSQHELYSNEMQVLKRISLYFIYYYEDDVVLFPTNLKMLISDEFTNYLTAGETSEPFLWSSHDMTEKDNTI